MANLPPFHEKEATSARLNKQEPESQASLQEQNPMYLYELRTGIKFYKTLILTHKNKRTTSVSAKKHKFV